jgi:general secretion pathway protein L
VTEAILVRFLPGALRQDVASVEVMWQMPDGEVSSGALAALLESQSAAPLLLVLSSADVQLTSVQLTRRQARHLQKVLPFLLEEDLIGDPEDLWYAVGGAVDGHYPVLACDAQALRALKGFIEDQGGHIVGAGVDGQLLLSSAPVLACSEQSSLLVQGMGAVLSLPADEAEDVLSALKIDLTDIERISDSDIWVRLRDNMRQRIELLHGDLRPQAHEISRWPSITPAWMQFAKVAAALLLVVWAMAWAQAWRYSHLADQASAQAAALYESLFPGDKATLKVAAQFKNRLAQLGGSGGSGGDFFALMTPLGDALSEHKKAGVQPRRVQYDKRDGVLILDLEASNYEAVEALRGTLLSAGLAAEVANFRNQGEQVAARVKVGAL